MLISFINVIKVKLAYWIFRGIISLMNYCHKGYCFMCAFNCGQYCKCVSCVHFTVDTILNISVSYVHFTVDINHVPKYSLVLMVKLFMKLLRRKVVLFHSVYICTLSLHTHQHMYSRRSLHDFLDL